MTSTELSPAPAGAAASLLTARAVRERCHRILEIGETDRVLGTSRSPELRAYLGDAPG